MFDFQNWLKDRMRDRGWKQAHLAQMLGVTEPYVSVILDPKKKRDMPGPDLLGKLEEIFDVQPRGLLFCHKMMNKIEAIGGLRAFAADPALLAIHGIEAAPAASRQSPDAARAARLADAAKWKDLADFAIEKITAERWSAVRERDQLRAGLPRNPVLNEGRKRGGRAR